MKRRQFLEASAAGVVAGVARGRSVSARESQQSQAPFVLSVHFIGVHLRVRERITKPQPLDLHNIVTLRGGGHFTVLMLQYANIASGGFGAIEEDPPGTPKAVQRWQITGNFRLPKSVEKFTAPTHNSVHCPTKAHEWTDTRWIFDATAAGAKLKKKWAGSPAVDALFQLNAVDDPIGEYIGVTQAEPPVREEDRQTIWKTCGKKQVLTDRFVYRVKTEDPTITGPLTSRMTLKPVAHGQPIDLFVVTFFDMPVDAPPKPYPKGYQLAHVALAHDLIDGDKPMPTCDGRCNVTEDPGVEEAAKLPDWVEKNRPKLRTSIDTFCPGFDVS